MGKAVVHNRDLVRLDMNVGNFFSTARSAISADLVAVMDDAARHGQSIDAALSQTSRDLDELLRTSNSIGPKLHSGSDAVDLLTNIGMGTADPSAVANLLPEQIEFASQHLTDNVRELLGRAQRMRVKFDIEQDAALAHNLLIDSAKIDDAIETLRQSSTYWQQDLLGAQAAAIENTLREKQFINAESAALLGHPVATAKIPIADARRGAKQFSSQHIVPDRIASPPRGFPTVSDATDAARTIVSVRPNTTIVTVFDVHSGRYHLLSAPIDTGPRSITEAKILRMGTKTRSVPTDATSNHHLIFGITLSDGTYVGTTNAATRAAWPSGFALPLDAKRLQELGVAKTHTPVAAASANARAQIDVEIAQFDAITDELVRKRLDVRDARKKISLPENVIDQAGKGNPESWELESIISGSTGAQELTLTYSRAFDGFTQPLAGYSVAEAIHRAHPSFSRRGNGLTVIMQDADGVVHHGLIRGNFSISSSEDMAIHQDLRAAIDNLSGTVYTVQRTEKGLAKLVSQKSPVTKIDALDTQAVFAKVFAGKTINFAKQTYSTSKDRIVFAPYSWDEPIAVLPAGSREQAIEMAQSSLEDLPNGARSILLVSIGKRADGTEILGMVQSSSAEALWNRSFGWGRHAHDSIVAAIDRDGVAFARGN